MNIGEQLSEATQQLQALSDSPRLDAEILLAFSLDKSRTWLMTWPDRELSQPEYQAFELLLQRRLQGEPIAHITGRREFWSLDLVVTPATLIPRPETELMIEVVLEAYPQPQGISLLDLGTGSGAIALALASERPGWNITATDQSTEALEVARLNAQQLGLTQVEFLQGSWFQPAGDRRFDIIASNPPYIAAADPHLQQGDVRFEPLSALAAGADGLDDIRHIAAQAGEHLKPGGLLIIEHGFDQKAQTHDIFTDYGFKKIRQHQDLAGNPRLISGIKP